MINTIAWLSEDEVVSHRLQTFHRERVAAIIAGHSPAKIQKGGALIVHLVPLECVKSPNGLTGAQLKSLEREIPVWNDSSPKTRFNVDGIIALEGEQGDRGYSQLFRDGRLESVMLEITRTLNRDAQNEIRWLLDAEIELAMFTLVEKYLNVCRKIGICVPIQLRSAIVGCEGVRICTNRDFRDISQTGIDRSTGFLPEVQIESVEAEPKKALRPWCDTLWQACGFERSFNFDDEGNWGKWRG